MGPSLGEVIDETATRFKENDLCYGQGTDNPWDEAVALVLAVTESPGVSKTAISS